MQSSDHYFTQSTSGHHDFSLWDRVRHIFETLMGIVFIFVPYRLLGQRYVKFICWLIRVVGPLAFAHNRVLEGLDIAFPNMDIVEKQEIAKSSWENIAKIPYDFFMAKYTPHKMRLKITGVEHLEMLKKSGKNAVFFSGHNACWEIFRIAAHRQGIDVAIIYRAFNNPYFDHYSRVFMNHGFASIFQKNATGVRKMIEHVRNKGNILILNDQRLAKGIKVPLFNRSALTAPSAAEMAIKYKLPLVPIFVTRKGWGDYEVIIHPEIKTEYPDLDRKQKTYKVLEHMNQVIEGHIRQYPSEWFWLHRRWRT